MALFQSGSRRLCRKFTLHIVSSSLFICPFCWLGSPYYWICNVSGSRYSPKLTYLFQAEKAKSGQGPLRSIIVEVEDISNIISRSFSIFLLFKKMKIWRKKENLLIKYCVFYTSKIILGTCGLNEFGFWP